MAAPTPESIPTPTMEELKERATSDLKRITETANAATKTALVSFSALAVIWFAQIHPEYGRLLDDVYPELKSATYTDIKKDQLKLDKTLDKLEDKVKEDQAAAPSNSTLVEAVASEPGQGRDSERDKRITNLQANASSQTKELQGKKTDLETRIKSISFKVFGLELPVPPLWASVVWNALLLGVLVYLARARVVVWRLCANALLNLKQLGRKSLDDIAGTGAMWIAPPPSRPGTSEYPTVQDLRNAFGWNRLQTLPSIAATAGFLLLTVLQLTVTAEGLTTLKAAHIFTRDVLTSTDLGPPGKNPYDTVTQNDTSVLNQRLESLATFLQRPAENDRKPSPYLLKQALTQLAVTPTQSSFIAGFLILMMGGMLLLVTWWFWPWSVPGRQTDDSVTRPLAIRALIFLAAVALFVVLSSAFPTAAWAVGTWVSNVLPAIIRFVTFSVLSFCLIELFMLAISPGRKQTA